MFTVFDALGGGLAVSIGAARHLFRFHHELGTRGLAFRIGLGLMVLAGIIEGIALVIALLASVLSAVTGDGELLFILAIGSAMLLGAPLRLLGLVALLFGFAVLLRVPVDDEDDPGLDAGPPTPRM